jgi:hypothetical protein
MAEAAELGQVWPTELVTDAKPDLFRVLSCLEFVIGGRMAGNRVLEVWSEAEI